MADNSPPSSLFYQALEAITTQAASLAAKIALVTEVAKRDHAMQEKSAQDADRALAARYAGRQGGEQEVHPAQNYYSPTFPSYAPKVALVKAVQWHGWERGPQDLGIRHPPKHLALAHDKGWLPAGNDRTLGLDITPGDWFVLSRDGNVLITVLSPTLFEATYVQVH